MVKKDIVCKASKMKRKAMIKLYEKYKNQIYSFNLLILEDEDRAKEETINAFNTVWDELKCANIIEDELFFKLAVKIFVKRNLKSIFEDKSIFNSITLKSYPKIEIEKEKYTGNIEKGIDLYKTAVSKTDRQGLNLIILYFAGRIDFDDIGRIIKVRRSSVKRMFEDAAANLSLSLQKVSANGTRNDTPTVNQLRSFYREYAKTLTLPEELDKNCLSVIKKKSKFRLW